MDSDAIPDRLVQVLIDPDEIAQKSMDLINMARRDYLTMETVVNIVLAENPHVPGRAYASVSHAGLT